MVRKLLGIFYIILISNYNFATPALGPEEFYRLKTDELQISFHDFNKGMLKNLQETNECDGFKITKSEVFDDGKVSYQRISLNSAKVILTLNVAKSNKLTNIKFVYDEEYQKIFLSKSYDKLPDIMVCVAIASMKTIYPHMSYEFIKKFVNDMWNMSNMTSFEGLFMTNKIRLRFNNPYVFEINHRVSKKDYDENANL